MQALTSIPIVLANIQDLHHTSSPETALDEYKKNVKKFIETLTKEVAELIDKYEKKISQLTEENKRLKDKKTLSPSRSPSPTVSRDTIFGTVKRGSPNSKSSRMPSPIKGFKNLDMMQTAKSNLFNPFVTGGLEDGQRFSSLLARYQSNDDDHNFPIELINPEPGEDGEAHVKSRFEAKSNRKKQREEELRHFLETGKKNLNSTTERFMNAIGREKPVELELPQKDLIKSDSEQSFRRQSSLNKSLGDICESLDTSFHSRKARKHNKKKKDQVQQQIQLKQKRDEETNKMLKEKGLKNLLQKLRDNVETSAQKPPEVIKSSKLMSCGKPSLSKSKMETPSENIESPTKSKRGSKVLFNPVPVDIGHKSKILKKDSINSPLSPERKPTSILKTSSQVLSGSISNISAIQFN